MNKYILSLFYITRKVKVKEKGKAKGKGKEKGRLFILI